MFFMNISPEYYLISADFEEYPELTLYDKEKIVIEKYKEEIIKYSKENDINTSLLCGNSNYHIILWRNLPKTNITDNNEDYLFQEMCQNIAKFEMPAFSTYIKDVNTLADGSVAKFIQRLCLLKKYSNSRPKFLDGADESLLSPSLESLLPEDLKGFMTQTAVADDEYSRILGFLEKIYTSVTRKDVENEEKGFIHYYFEWQKGNISAETACKELDGMSKRTFYKYVAEFEQSPLYSQFCKLHAAELFNKAKKGPLTIDPETFYKDAAPVFQNLKADTNNEFKNPELIALENIDTSILCNTYNLSSSLDAYRTFLAVKKKLKIK